MTTAAAMNITREEAAARAAALTVDAYEVSLDLTRGAEHFHTATTVTFAATQDAVGTHTWIDFVAEQAPTVRVTGSTRGDRTVVEVADNGIGIPESAIGSVREAFTRVHGVGGYTGSGLGLTLADRVVRRHAGTLEIESQLREGTTVRFDLPTAAP